MQAFKEAPFRIEEKGWGEFDLTIVLHITDRGGDQTILHDLNFTQNRYEVLHNINFPTNKPNLYKLLQESGPVPPVKGAAGQTKTAASSVAKAAAATPVSSPGTPQNKRKIDSTAGAAAGSKLKKKTKSIEKGNVDLELLAEGLQKLSEDDLLEVVQMVTDKKTSDMYIKNDVEEGEFHMDLYTLPDSLLKNLWDFVKKRIEV